MNFVGILESSVKEKKCSKNDNPLTSSDIPYICCFLKTEAQPNEYKNLFLYLSYDKMMTLIKHN